MAKNETKLNNVPEIDLSAYGLTAEEVEKILSKMSEKKKLRVEKKAERDALRHSPEEIAKRKLAAYNKKLADIVILRKAKEMGVVATEEEIEALRVLKAGGGRGRRKVSE